MDTKVINIPPVNRAESQPNPNTKARVHTESTEENQGDTSNPKSQQQNANDNTTKQHSRPIKEIRGILKCKMKQKTFVVVFADTEKEETVPIAQLHKYYTKELLDFYEAHIEQAPLSQKSTAENSKPPAPSNT